MAPGVRLLVALGIALCVFSARDVIAQTNDATTEAVEGHVVELYDSDVVVDLSRDEGAKEGAVVELWRPLKLKHPVTGETITELFRLGRLRLTQVQGALSLARPDGKLARPAQAGDVVILRVPKRDKPKAPPVAAFPESAAPTAPGAEQPAEPQPSPAPTSGPPRDTDAETVLRILEFVRGKGVRARIIAYENYVKHRPNSRYAAVLWEEAQKLRALVALEAESVGEGPTLRSFHAPDEALAGTPVSLVVEIEDASGAVLHSRTPAEVSYTTTPMTSVGPGYYSGTLPSERSTSPGIDYFVEAVTATGAAVAVVGTADRPLRLNVVEAPRPEPPPKHDSVASVATDYANWNLEKNNDFVWQTEGFVGMRFEDEGLRAARTGFGVYRGRGGSLDDLDNQGLEGRNVGLTYGYLEGEYGISNFTGLVGRVLVGLENRGVTGGFMALVRIGNDRSTNLLLGGEVLGSIGLRGITQLELATFPKVPILFRTEVTNQPAGMSGRGEREETISREQGDVGARAIAQVGYRIVPELTLAVRGSYQGRTINHAGPGFGGGVTYTW
jgi:hypothetical protein